MRGSRQGRSQFSTTSIEAIRKLAHRLAGHAPLHLARPLDLTRQLGDAQRPDIKTHGLQQMGELADAPDVVAGRRSIEISHRRPRMLEIHSQDALEEAALAL